MTGTRFASLVLDVDSTLCGVEGIDWLAARRGPEVGARIALVTDRAMNGELPLEAVYGERLSIIRPTLDDVRALAEVYAASVAPGAAETIARLRALGLRIVLVSGGIRQAIEPVARALGFDRASLAAVSLEFDQSGEYASYDTRSPLASQTGKEQVVRALELPRPVLAVGDGSTDIPMRRSADALAAFVGFARREPVVDAADHVVSNFAEIERLVVDLHGG